MLRLRRKHGRCDSDNLSLPSTDDEDDNHGGIKKKNCKNSLNTKCSSSSDDEDSEEFQKPYTMGNFPVEIRTCIVCHRVGCKGEHVKRKPKTLYTNPEETLDGTCIFVEEEKATASRCSGDGPNVLSLETESINSQKAIGDVYKEKLIEMKKQLDIEYADDDVEENDNVVLFAEDIKNIAEWKGNESGDIISISSDSSKGKFVLEDMNSALPEVFSQIDKLYKDIVNEEGILNVRPPKSPQWDDYMEGSFLSKKLSQWNFGVDINKSNIENYLDGSFISIELSQWNFGVDIGKIFRG